MDKHNVIDFLRALIIKETGVESISDEKVKSLMNRFQIPENINSEELEGYLLKKVKDIYSSERVIAHNGEGEKIKDFGSIVIDENTTYDETVHLISISIKTIADNSYELITINSLTEGFNNQTEGYSKFNFSYSSNVLEDKKGLITVYKKCTPPSINAKMRVLIGAPDKSKINLLDGVYATDIIDGDLSHKIEVNSSGLDLRHEGVYPVVYYVKNSRGTGSRLCLWYNVVSKEPNLAVKDIFISAGESIDNEVLRKFISATDIIDGDITNKVQLQTDNLDLNRQGEYQTYVQVINSNDKIAKLPVRVFVKAKAPEILVDALEISAGTNLTADIIMEHVKAIDQVDGDITKKVICDFSNVDVQVAGKYAISLNVKNSNDVETNIIGTVQVIAAAPVIEANDFVIKVNSDVDWLAFAGINAHDAVDGDLSSIVTCFHSDVNLDQQGDYSAYYMVRNSNNKQATTKITVHVIEN